MTTTETITETTHRSTAFRGRRTWHFVRHYLEMVVAMFAGMFLLGWLQTQAFPTVELTTETGVLVMATNMAVGMGAWMRFRGHTWRSIAEMSGAMYLPFAVLLVPYWTGGISADTVIVWGHLLMFPAMALVMVLLRTSTPTTEARSPPVRTATCPAGSLRRPARAPSEPGPRRSWTAPSPSTPSPPGTRTAGRRTTTLTSSPSTRPPTTGSPSTSASSPPGSFAVLQAVDGVALKHAVDSLAAAPPGPRGVCFHDAAIVRRGEWAMAGYSRITLGLAVAAAGLAVLGSRALPRWTAGPALVASERRAPPRCHQGSCRQS